MNAKDFINPCALAERNAVNEIQIAQLIDQRDALLLALKAMLYEFDYVRPINEEKTALDQAKAAIALAEGKEAA